LFEVAATVFSHTLSVRQRYACLFFESTETAMESTTSARFLANREAATFLNLSPRTLEKMRVIGGGPRFRKFGRRVLYAVADLEVWANARSCDSTSDASYYVAR
jgi:hypothetical protein